MVMNVNTAGLAEGLPAPRSAPICMLREVFSQTGANRVSSRPTAKTCKPRAQLPFAAHAAKDSECARSQKSVGLDLPSMRDQNNTTKWSLKPGRADKSGMLS
jgi:hypothetical protein